MRARTWRPLRVACRMLRSGRQFRTGSHGSDARVLTLGATAILARPSANSLEPEMIENVNQFLGTVAESELAKAARRSARTIWAAHRAAFETTRVETGKVLTLAIGEGRKRAARVQTPVAARAPVARKATRRSTRRAA